MTLHEPTWDDARLAAFAAAQALEPTELPLADCLGLSLAAPLVARSQVPAFDTAMMDGWAVAGDGPWQVVGHVLAGSVGGPLATGTAVGIATGAPVPDGATAVLRREWGEVDGNALRTTQTLSDGLDIRAAGDEALIGDALLPAGTPVTPPVIGLAALVGNDALTVHRRPSVTALVLGDELVRHGIPPHGKVRDALGVQILDWAKNAEQRGVQYVGDTLDATITALRNADADLIFTTGGTARGPVDHMHAALAALDAELVVDEVRVRPGHPMLLAKLPSGQFVIGLPGNPLAAVAGFLTFADPILRAMRGASMPALATTITTAAIKAPAGERRLIPASRATEHATPTEFWGSAMLRGIAQSDCFLVTAPGGAAAGDTVGILELPW